MKVVERCCGCDRQGCSTCTGVAPTCHEHARVAAIVRVTETIHDNDTTDNRKHTG